MSVLSGCWEVITTIKGYQMNTKLTIADKDDEDSSFCALHLQPVDTMGQICTTNASDEPLQVPP